MAIRNGARELGRLGYYVLYAGAIHATLITLGLLSSCRSRLPTELATTTNSLVAVEMDAPPAQEPTSLPGGGLPSPNRDNPTRAVAPTRAASMTIKKAPPKPAPLPDENRDELAKSAPPTAPDNGESSQEAAQTLVEQRHHDMQMAAAAAAAGTGPGANGGPGGPGAGAGPPAIRGTIAFGNGDRGALTGKVCFFPEGIMRIADIHDCVYVATVYTDMLNIPERHFHDGFPGVTGRSEWFLIDYSGTFTVREYGGYDFRLHSDDGSYLYIDDKLVIDNDGKHAPASKSGSIPLFAGEHRIRVRYAQTNDRMALQLFVTVPGNAERLFTPQL